MTRARLTEARALALKAISLILGVLVLCHVFRGLELQNSIDRIRDMGPALALAGLPFLAATALDTVAWRNLFPPGPIALRLSTLWLLRSASEAIHLALAGGVFLSEGVAPVVLRRRFSTPYSESLGAAWLRRILILRAQAFYLGAGLCLGFGMLRETVHRLGHDDTLVVGILVVAPGLFAASCVLVRVTTSADLGFSSGPFPFRLPFRLPLRWPFRVGFRVPAGVRAQVESWEHRLRAVAERLRTGSSTTRGHIRSTLMRRRTMLTSTALFFGAWTLEAIETYFLLRLLGVDIDLFAVLAIEPSVTLVRHAAFFVPAGLGFQEAAYLLFLQSPSLAIADPLSTSAALSFLKRAKEALFIAVGLCILGCFFRSYSMKETTKEGAMESFNA
ncbi:MAG: flippase-like domain-containing protein [Deltaproteobacteria bacterium]|nr:flippase-like domain-containing protein [Deltaproteobacteria bacterium]